MSILKTLYTVRRLKHIYIYLNCSTYISDQAIIVLMYDVSGTNQEIPKENWQRFIHYAIDIWIQYTLDIWISLDTLITYILVFHILLISKSFLSN